MENNWYIELELEFDPNPVHDETKIAERIEEKRKTWSRSASTNKMASKYIGMLDKIRADMIGEQNIRNELIKNACEVTYPPIDKTLKFAQQNGEIPNHSIEKIAKKLNVDAAIVKNRIKALGLKVGEAKAVDYAGIVDKIKAKPKGAARFDDALKNLQVVSAGNLYDFLKKGDKTARNLPPETLKKTAAEKKSEFRKTGPIDSAGQKLCTLCELTFKDKNGKAEYDEYLEYSERMAVLKEIKDLAEISGNLNPDQQEVFIERLTEVFKNRTRASEVFVAYCEVNNIRYTQQASESSTKKLIVCRCGVTNDVTDGKRTACKTCGEDLHISCPKCSESNEASVKVCKCGFKFDNIDKAVALCHLAEDAIAGMNFEGAEVHLSEANNYWSGSDKVSEIRAKLEKRRQSVGNAAESMRDAVSKREFYEADRQYKNIQKLFPEFKDAGVEEQIKNALNSAATALNQAKAAKSERDTIDFCLKAFDSCADYPGINELVPEPQPPANIKISTDGNTKTNIISWDKSDSGGTVYYVVVRKVNAAPISIEDGETLERLSMCTYSDSKIEAGVSYFYAVFTERVGKYSKPLINASAAVNLFEISNLSITAGDTTLQLGWDSLPTGATADIYRKSDKGKDEKLSSTTLTSFLDSGLRNDSLYRYHVKLVYSIGGITKETQGITVSATPTKPPEPVESLKIEQKDEDVFTATWNAPENTEVKLYCSEQKPAFKFGAVISQQLLEKEMTQLALTRISDTEASFSHKTKKLLYVVATSVKSGSVVIGAASRVRYGEDIKISRVAPINGKINIFVQPPEGTTSFIVLYRFDRYPDDLSDKEAMRKLISIKQFQHDGALIICPVEQKKFYFSVFAEFYKDGEKDYSGGSDYLFSNVKEEITYSISVSKGLFKSGEVILRFEAVSKSFSLPDIDVMCSNGAIPMFKESANLFYSIEAQPDRGSHEIKIPLPKGLQKDTYVKPFIKDEALYSSHSLKLQQGFSPKIS